MSCHMFNCPSWPVKHYHGFWIFLQLGIRKQTLEIKKKNKNIERLHEVYRCHRHQKASENRRTASKPLHKSMLTTAWMARRGQEAGQPINKARNLQIVLWEGSTVAACVAACCSTNHITSTVSAVSVIFWSASITSITGSAPSPPQALGVPQPIRCPGKSSVPCFQMFPDVSRCFQVILYLLQHTTALRKQVVWTETRSALNEECSAWNSWHFVHQQLQALQHLIICIDLYWYVIWIHLLSLALPFSPSCPRPPLLQSQSWTNQVEYHGTMKYWASVAQTTGPIWTMGPRISLFHSFLFLEHVSFGFLIYLIWSSLIFQCFNLSHGLKPFLVAQVGRTVTESK